MKEKYEWCNMHIKIWNTVNDNQTEWMTEKERHEHKKMINYHIMTKISEKF